METASSLLALAVLGIILIALIWRRASRRRSLPCPSWLRWLVELDNPFTRTNRAVEIISHLNLQTGMTVLDMGCGPGRLTVPLAKALGSTGKVVAMDIQPGMIRRAKAKAEASGLTNIDFLLAGAEEHQLGTETFDIVLLVTVLGEIPNRETALRHIYRALKPGGTLSVTEIIFDPHFQQRKTVNELASAAGFSERGFWGNCIAYTLHLVKPAQR